MDSSAFAGWGSLFKGCLVLAVLAIVGAGYGFYRFGISKGRTLEQQDQACRARGGELRGSECVKPLP